jgi:hypothetical protein
MKDKIIILTKVLDKTILTKDKDKIILIRVRGRILIIEEVQGKITIIKALDKIIITITGTINKTIKNIQIIVIKNDLLMEEIEIILKIIKIILTNNLLIKALIIGNHHNKWILMCSLKTLILNIQITQILHFHKIIKDKKIVVIKDNHLTIL